MENNGKNCQVNNDVNLMILQISVRVLEIIRFARARVSPETFFILVVLQSKDQFTQMISLKQKLRLLNKS